MRLHSGRCRFFWHRPAVRGPHHSVFEAFGARQEPKKDRARQDSKKRHPAHEQQPEHWNGYAHYYVSQDGATADIQELVAPE